MARVTGIGGVFFRSDDPGALKAWYADHLGVELAPDFHGSTFKWREKDAPHVIGATVWGLFDRDTSYFGISGQSYMVNYRVDDLDGMLAKLREAGIEVDDNVQDYEFGRFGWATDPDGIRFELWEPKGEEEKT